MNKRNFILSGFAITGLVLTSCLNEEYEGKMVANQIGLIVNDPSSGKHLMEVHSYGTIYDPLFDTELKADSCYLINFGIDTLSSENSSASIEANGYKTVTMLDFLPIDKGKINESPAADTAALLTNEQIVINPIARSYVYHQGGRLVLFSSYNKHPEQTSKWILSYDPENRVSDVNEKSLYTVYLRSTIESISTTSPDSLKTSVEVSPNAFDIRSYMNRITEEETAKGRAAFYLKIRYLSSIKLNRDTLHLTWNSTDSLLFNVK